MFDDTPEVYITEAEIIRMIQNQDEIRKRYHYDECKDMIFAVSRFQESQALQGCLTIFCKSQKRVRVYSVHQGWIQI